MIHVRRERVTPPPDWLEQARKEQRAAVEFFRSPQSRGPFAFRVYRRPETRALLNELFKGKCAFCEWRYTDVGATNSEQFRPKSRAIGLDGSVVEPGYYWLASEWSNLYLSCQFCNRNKANRFPVVGRRARKPGEERDEAALILDPCVDDPERYLVFRDDGFLASLPLDKTTRSELGLARYRGQDRAQITIDVFGLNRTDLVSRRGELIALLRQEFESALAAWTAKSTDEALGALRRLLVVSDDLELVALRRQLAGEFRNRALGRIPEELETASAGLEARVVEQGDKQTAFARLESHQIRVKTSSIEDRADKLIFRHTATITRVEIKNFRNIEHLEFEFPSGSEERIGWKVLLGENGVGKSSVLQAVALTLMGSRASRLRDVNKGRLLRDGARPAMGYVRVYLSAEADPLEMHISRRGIFFPSGGSNLRTFLLGFGAARWLPRRGSLRPDDDPLIRIQNLFNPFVPLHDAPVWLMGLDRSQFGRTKGALLRLLQRSEGDRLRRLKGRVVIHRDGMPRSKAISLEELSDGYQAMLAVAGEISEITAARWQNVADAEGLVLLDELEAHLHPRWKMRVVESLRKAFPRMQFLATTHDPLCLRGLDAGEILVLDRDDDGELVALDDLPSTERLRVDQLLTSRLFGLGSTLDPRTEAELTEYYSLLGKRRRGAEEETRLQELKGSVGSRGMLGTTRRDQAIYQIIDEYLATEEPRVEQEWVAVSDETKRRVVDLLNPSSMGRPK
jgi:uncharacterized protein (TIGR02646 family)